MPASNYYLVPLHFIGSNQAEDADNNYGNVWQGESSANLANHE